MDNDEPDFEIKSPKPVYVSYGESLDVPIGLVVIACIIIWTLIFAGVI